MKKRDLYLERVNIDDTFSMQINHNNEESLMIYENNVEIDNFSLRKRIYTLFKLLQEYTNASGYIEDSEKKNKLYGKEIHIKNDIYMKLTNEYHTLAVAFYSKEENKEEELLYLTKLNYMTQKLFYMMLIPEKVIKIPNYQIMNPKEFKDLMDILSVIKI